MTHSKKNNVAFYTNKSTLSAFKAQRMCFDDRLFTHRSFLQQPEYVTSGHNVLQVTISTQRSAHSLFIPRVKLSSVEFHEMSINLHLTRHLGNRVKSRKTRFNDWLSRIRETFRQE